MASGVLIHTALSPTDRRPLLTEHDVAELFRVTPRTVRRWAAAGELEPVRVGGTTRYRAEAIAALIDPSNEKRPAGEPGASTTSAEQGRHDAD